MEEEIWRVAGLILEAPLTRRNLRELLYCGLGGLAGALGFYVLVVLLAAGLTVSISIIGTVVGLLLITLTLRLSRRIGSLHRRLSNRVLGQHVEAPLRFQPGTGLLGLLAQAAVLLIGGDMVRGHQLTVGELTAYVLYMNSLFLPVQQLVAIYTNYQQGQAAIVKLRPIMMTALVAALGLLPAAMSTGVGTDSQRPFALVIVAGLISRLAISIYLMPALYTLVAREGDRLKV